MRTFIFFMILLIASPCLADRQEEVLSGISSQMSVTISDLLWRYDPDLIEKTLKSSVQNYGLKGVTLWDTGLMEYHAAWPTAEGVRYYRGDTPMEIQGVQSFRHIRKNIRHKGKKLGELVLFYEIFTPSFDLTEKEKAWLKEHPVIRVSNELDFPPYDFVADGKPKGYSIDLTRLIAEKIGVTVHFVNGYSWSELVELFKKGELDLLHSLRITPDRLVFGLFSNQYRRLKTHFVTQADYGEQISDIRQLYGKTFVVGKGWFQEEYLRRNHPQINLLRVDNSQEMLEVISSGKADVTALSSDVLQYLIKKHGMRDLTVGKWFREIDGGQAYTYHYMAPKNEPELISVLNKALASLSLIELDELEKKWFGESKKERPTIFLTEEEKAFLRNKGPLKMCSDPGRPPIEWIDRDGKHKGVSADFINLISEQINHEIKLIPTKSWNETIENAKAGKCDFISAVSQTDERSKYLKFTNVYQELDVVIATREEQIYIQDMETLAGKKVGVIKSSIFENRLREAYPSIEIVPLNDMVEGLRMVEEKKIIGFVDNLISLAYAIQKNGFVSLKISGRVGEPIQLRIGVRKEEAVLQAILGRALDSISPEKRQEFASKWTTVKMEQKVDYTKLWYVLSLAAVVILGVGYWNRKLASFNHHIAQANEELAETQNIARLGTWVLNARTRQTTWSKEALRIAGFENFSEPPSFEEYAGRLHPDDVDILEKNQQKALNGEDYEVELRYKKTDGDYNYTLTRAKPIFKNGKIIKVQGTMLDLTRLKQVEMALRAEMRQRLQIEQDLKGQIKEREKAEQALRESEAQLRLVTDSIPAYMAYVDAKTLEYLFVNRMFLTGYGKKRHEIVGHHIKEIIGQANFEYALPYIEKAKQGKSVTYINTFPLKEGTRWINVHYEPDFDENGKVRALFVLSHDISERMQAEKDLSIAKKAAERANQAKSEFIANMSHEIRTPLNAVIGFSELLTSLVEDKKQKDYLSAIKSSGKNLLTLINDILDLSKIEAGQFNIQYRPVKLKKLLDEVEQIFAIQVSRKNLKFSTEIDTALPHFFMLDEIRLRQILLNIVGNAVKFTDKGFVKIRVQPLCDVNQDKIDLEFLIEDTGIGITETDIKTIFDSFKQQYNQDSSRYGGTGLGLTISKRLAEIMNGQISVESAVGSGSIFKIMLNQVAVSREKIAPPEEISGIDNLWFENGKVLIVDDVESNRLLLEEMLKKVNLEVMTAENGQEAILTGSEYGPDIILMDVKMPVMDGFQAAEHFKKNNETQKIPIIAITASASETDVSSSKESRFDGVITKPIKTEMLFAELLKHLPAKIKRPGIPEQGFDLNCLLNRLSDKNTSVSPQLLPEAEHAFLNEWKQFEKRQPIDKAKAFGERIKNFGSEHEMEIFTEYGRQLINAVNSFDIDNMRLILSKFENLLNGLKSFTDKG